MNRSRVEDALRVLRLALFSVAATVLALGAHVLAGGAVPALLPTISAVLLPAAAGLLLTRRRRGLVEITVVLGAVQLVLHEVFAAAASAGTASAGAASAGDAGHAMHAMSTLDVAGPIGVVMPLTHAVAVALTAVLLARGERTLDLLAAWWRSVPVVVAATSALPVPAPRWLPAVVDAPPVPAPGSASAATPVVRRGPPLPVC